MAYGRRIPPTARARSWPLREQNGVLLAWHDPGGSEPGTPRTPGTPCTPDWEMPIFDESKWTPHVSMTRRILGHPQEVLENTADFGHFRWIHGTHVVRATDEPRLDGPLFEIPIESDPEGVVPELRVDHPPIEGSNLCHGPGLAAATIVPKGSGLGAVQRLYVTPVDGDHVELRGMVNVERLADPAATETLARGLTKAVFEQWEADIPIWEHKVYRPRPALNDAEPYIGLFRRWYRQFYAQSGAFPDASGITAPPFW